MRNYFKDLPDNNHLEYDRNLFSDYVNDFKEELILKGDGELCVFLNKDFILSFFRNETK